MARLSKAETRKDTIQVTIEAGANHAGKIATIVTGAVRDVSREIGDFATEVFEIRDASRRAEVDGEPGSPAEPGPAPRPGE